MKKLRCAIYTRKSTEEGLEQSFNSLDAQREACEAYVLSQAGEGWSCLKQAYDDGGYSGGSMERPGLELLLKDVAAGRVDVVVVYKVDRLTRSLADFARIVEILDKAEASFVSVTQAFNTTTSMGRLTLNVLLSFAQFEREVTGERIRDKIAASKAKGMWMGGYPPLGYDVSERALAVNRSEAETVRRIFRQYLEERSVLTLRDRLAGDGVCAKRWTSKSGRLRGGGPLSHGGLYQLLSNRLFIGEIVHRGVHYKGQHEAIVDTELFEAAQRKLAKGAPCSPNVASFGRRALMLGKLYDDVGSVMTSAHANKKGRRYFYYVSTALRDRKPAGSLPRVNAIALEEVIRTLVEPLLAATWQSDDGDRVFAAVRQTRLRAESMSIELELEAIDHNALSQGEVQKDTLRIETQHALARPRHCRSLVASKRVGGLRTDRALVRAVVEARRWADLLASSDVRSIAELAKRESACPIYVGQLLPMAYLAPDLVEIIIDGRQPPRLTLAALLDAKLPHAWSEQRALFAHFG